MASKAKQRGVQAAPHLHKIVVGVLGLVGISVAQLSNAQPTGNAVVDLIWLAAGATILTLAALRASTWSIAIFAGAAAMVTTEALQLLAIAVLLSILLPNFIKIPTPQFNIAIALSCFNLFLRAPGLAFQGAVTIVAILAAVPLLISGYRGFCPRARRNLEFVSLGLVAAIAVWAVPTAISLWDAKNNLDHAINQTMAAIENLREFELENTGDALTEIEQTLVAAVDTLNKPWVRATAMIPVAAQNVRAIRGRANDALSIMGSVNRAKLGSIDGAFSIKAGRIQLGDIFSQAPALKVALEEVTSASRQLNLPRSGWLASPVNRALDSFSSHLNDLEADLVKATQAVESIPNILGFGNTRHYLVLLTTTAESRPLGGFVGNWAIVTATNGRLSLSDSGRVAPLSDTPDAPERTFVASPEFMARYDRYGINRYLVNVTASPDLPTDAAVAIQLFAQTGIGPVDGVLILDPRAIGAISEITGPVAVEMVTSSMAGRELEEFLVRDQYAKFLDLSEREEMLDTLIVTAIEKFAAAGNVDADLLVDTLGPMFSERHIMFWSTDPNEAEFLQNIGVDGSFPTPTDTVDLFALRSANATPNKLDAYLTRDITYQVELNSETSQLMAEAEITLTNQAPHGLSDYALGQPNPERVPGVNRQWISVYSGHQLSQLTVNGEVTATENLTELGWKVYSFYLDIPQGEAAVLNLKFEGTAQVEDYELLWSGQPLFNADLLEVAVLVDGQIASSFHGVLRGDLRVQAAS